MKYLVFDSESAADSRNHEEAIRRGCCNGITLYWWEKREIEGKVGLAVGDDNLQNGETTIDYIITT